MDDGQELHFRAAVWAARHGWFGENRLGFIPDSEGETTKITFAKRDIGNLRLGYEVLILNNSTIVDPSSNERGLLNS